MLVHLTVQCISHWGERENRNIFESFPDPRKTTPSFRSERRATRMPNMIRSLDKNNQKQYTSLQFEGKKLTGKERRHVETNNPLMATGFFRWTAEQSSESVFKAPVPSRDHVFGWNEGGRQRARGYAAARMNIQPVSCDAMNHVTINASFKTQLEVQSSPLLKVWKYKEIIMHIGKRGICSVTGINREWCFLTGRFRKSSSTRLPSTIVHPTLFDNDFPLLSTDQLGPLKKWY